MNAAFLLVTTAWFAGDTAAAGPCCGTSYAACSTCDTCGHSGPKLLDKLRGAFRHGGSCDTCAAPACPAPAPVCAPKCAPAPCDTCGKGPKFLERLRACFHHEKACCDGGCSTGTCASCGDGAPAMMPPPKGGEPIPVPPKKMPNPGSPPPSQTSIYAPSAQAGSTPAIDAAPNAAQTPPAIVPNVESENLRSPF